MISAQDQLLRLTVAAVLGAVIGLERERLDRAAGLRTHALVAMASALIMLVSAYGFYGVTTPDRTVVADPTRIAAQVVSGIGFLGAGVIIFRKNTVRGLTTAASVWAVAGIGLAVGVGLYLTASAATILVLLIQGALRPLERRVFRRTEYSVSLRLQPGHGSLASIERALAACGVAVAELRVRTTDTKDRVWVKLETVPPEAADRVVRSLRLLEGVQEVTYTSASPSLATNGDEEADADDTEIDADDAVVDATFT